MNGVRVARQNIGGVTGFHSAVATPEGDWRHIVRFGCNVASYKFALGAVRSRTAQGNGSLL